MGQLQDAWKCLITWIKIMKRWQPWQGVKIVEKDLFLQIAKIIAITKNFANFFANRRFIWDSANSSIVCMMEEILYFKDRNNLSHDKF